MLLLLFIPLIPIFIQEQHVLLFHSLVTVTAVEHLSKEPTKINQTFGLCYRETSKHNINWTENVYRESFLLSSCTSYYYRNDGVL